MEKDVLGTRAEALMLRSTQNCFSLAHSIGTMSSSNQQRFLWLDMAKGWGSFLVVCGHVMLGLEGAGILQQESNHWSLLYQAKYLFNMPLFFVIAGLAVESSLRKGKQAFLLDKIFSLVYPFFLWSFVVVFLQSQAGQSINHPKSLSALQTIWYDPPSPFWMLYSLLICHLVTAWLPERNRSTNLLILTTGALALMFAVAWGWDHSLEKENLLERTIYHAWFYALGFKFRDWIINTAGGPRRALSSSAIFVGVAAIYLYSTENFNHFSAAGIPGALAGIALILLTAKTFEGTFAKVWGVVGRASMSIYVMHVIFGAAVRVGLLKIGVTNPAAHFVLGVTLAIAIPLGTHTLFRHLKMLPLFGLARFRPNQGKRFYLPSAAFKNEALLATSE